MKREFATGAEREVARELYCMDSPCDIEVDDDAKVSRVLDDDTGELLGVWVQGWLWVNAENLPS